MINHDEIIEKIDKLEPIPQIAHQVIALAGNEDASVADLVSMVEYEPAITANLLRICNSAYFGFAMPIESVRHAVSLLGFKQIVEIVVLSAASTHLNSSQKGYNLDKGELWSHAVTSAVIARTMSQMLKFEDSQLVFTGALLKDIGKIVLDHYVDSYADKITELVDGHNYSFVAAEREVLGTDHAAIGALMAEKWQFGSNLVTIVANHHLPSDESMRHEATAMVYLSDVLSIKAGTENATDWQDDFFDASIIEFLGLSEDNLEKLQIQSWDIKDRSQSLMLA